MRRRSSSGIRRRCSGRSSSRRRSGVGHPRKVAGESDAIATRSNRIESVQQFQDACKLPPRCNLIQLDEASAVGASSALLMCRLDRAPPPPQPASGSVARSPLTAIKAHQAIRSPWCVLSSLIPARRKRQGEGPAEIRAAKRGGSTAIESMRSDFAWSTHDARIAAPGQSALWSTYVADTPSRCSRQEAPRGGRGARTSEHHQSARLHRHRGCSPLPCPAFRPAVL
jgi:hypothetical protein